MAKTKFRVGSWNLRFGRADDALIADMGIDLLALQEVTPEAFERFSRHFDWGFTSLVRHDAEVVEKHAPAIMGTSRFTARLRPSLSHLVAPWKLVVADLSFTGKGGFLAFGSYHAFNGQRGLDGCDKPRLTMQVGEWLEHEEGPVILGLDANSPEVDHPDFDQMECCFSWLGPRRFERRLLGPEATHECRDVLRTWLASTPSELDRLTRLRPSGPLAVSHRTGHQLDKESGDRGTPRRYDHILATQPDFRVHAVSYLYDEACAAGSDHALVIADLEADVEGRYAGTSDHLLPTEFIHAPRVAGPGAQGAGPA